MLHKQGSLQRLPLPRKINNLQDKQQPTALYRYEGTEWKLVQSK